MSIATVRQMPLGDESLRRRFHAHVRTDVRMRKRRLVRRALGAAALGIGTGVALRYGSPSAARSFAGSRQVAEGGIRKAAKTIVGHKLGASGFRRMTAKIFSEKGSVLGGEKLSPNLKHVEDAKRNLVLGALRYAGSSGGEWAARAAGRRAPHIGAGVGGSYLGLGAARDRRKTRRRQGEVARRMLLS